MSRLRGQLSHPHEFDRALVKAALNSRLFGTTAAPIRMGRFELQRRLGAGAMGGVYQAWDHERGTQVALRLLNPRDAHVMERFAGDFVALSRVSHPNLVALYELFHEAEAWFFSMELIDGVPLDQWNAGRPPGDFARLDAVIGQLASALQAIHIADRSHGDLKPSNLRIAADDRLVVLDLGRVDHAGIGAACATAYLAPELLAGMPASPAGDWYAVGAVLFEALTGRAPFLGSDMQVMRAKRSHAAPDPRSLVADLPHVLSEVCLGLLAAEPERRLDGRALLQFTGQAASHASLAAE